MPKRSRALPLQAYITALIVVFTAAAGVGIVVLQRVQPVQDPHQIRQREIAMLIVGFVSALLASYLLFRRLAVPLRRLSDGVRAAAGDEPFEPILVSGPREVVHLTQDFNRMVASLRDELVERRLIEQRVRESERTYRLLFDANPQPMWVCDDETLAFLEVNDFAADKYGYDRDEMLAMRATDLDAEPGATSADGPTRHRKGDGTIIDVELESHPISFGDRAAHLVVAHDVTESERLQRQVQQRQRLESLGKLAGGVAHDFNNLLAVILSYAGFVEERLADAATADSAAWEPVRQDVVQIGEAARRATELTHQLLRFARREVVEPRVISLNAVVSDMEQLLRRSIGAHVRLQTVLHPDLWRIEADPGQLEQVLMNLAVNARDAMPDGGTLTIDTDNVVIDEAYAAARPGLRPGAYVRLRVSDTGTGMAPEVRARAFDPFFTTKGDGEGTGLGLATVYGIVTQAGGFPRIYSEPGHGTTFGILLPFTDRQAEVVGRSSIPTRHGRGETLLVVDDEAAMREVVGRMLGQHGYEVLLAGSGEEALRLSAGHDGPIDLLLTDVVMPTQLGREVAAAITERRPETRIVYMSGYAQSMLDSAGSLPPDVTLVEKPFSVDVLLTTVRRVLDSHAGSSR